MKPMSDKAKKIYKTIKWTIFGVLGASIMIICILCLTVERQQPGFFHNALTVVFGIFDAMLLATVLFEDVFFHKFFYGRPNSDDSEIDSDDEELSDGTEELTGDDLTLTDGNNDENGTPSENGTPYGDFPDESDAENGGKITGKVTGSDQSLGDENSQKSETENDG